jgi:hypothetical protein
MQMLGLPPQVLVFNDQLRIERGEGRVFVGFGEGPCNFRPTYRLDHGSADVYDTSKKQRIPSWTDRVLYRPVRRLHCECLSWTLVSVVPVVVVAGPRASRLRACSAGVQLSRRAEARVCFWMLECGLVLVGGNLQGLMRRCCFPFLILGAGWPASASVGLRQHSRGEDVRPFASVRRVSCQPEGCVP